MSNTRGRCLTLMGLVLALVVAALPAPSRADLFTAEFTCITNNNGTDPGIGEAQAVMKIGSDQPTDSWIDFTLRSIGPEQSSITHVYFYDFGAGPLSRFETAAITSSTGVAFVTPAKPGNLPGLRGYLGARKDDLDSWRVFSAHSRSPRVRRGVNNDDPSETTDPEEWLNIKFYLNAGGSDTFSDVLGDLTAGRLLVGIKIQGFEDGGSEGFVNDPPHAPLPGAVLLGMLGMSAAGWRLRRFA